MGQPGPDGAPDLDDMNFDSLREQGEKLGLNGPGGDDSQSQLASLRRGPIAGAMNAKKMRKVMGQSPNPGGAGGSGSSGSRKVQPVDEKKELDRLKKEIREKKILERKLQ